MNTYGKFAQEAWRTTAPAEYALIPGPQAWFEALGEEAAQRVGELMMELAGPDPVGESYLEKVGRLNASRMQAEEIVRAEMLTPDVMETEGDDETEEDEVDRQRRELREAFKEIAQTQRELLDAYRNQDMDQNYQR